MEDFNTIQDKLERLDESELDTNEREEFEDKYKLERLDESELDTNEREEFEDKYFDFIAPFQNIYYYSARGAKPGKK
ncbi:hypothetical protein QE152_g13623 [Popillia japonica]|uniref:Uncharacterized protein n=1 Tax=Popillia japonica TaxID=7064 RepID=A0AAW1LC41_POPJA